MVTKRLSLATVADKTQRQAVLIAADVSCLPNAWVERRREAPRRNCLQGGSLTPTGHTQTR